ncbi:putative MFS family arabinose efflux permease [Rubricella aquisinus]|uniref:Putative MFS family arabinose efflux permease n=1 Tax=Rubricella aquisinus TaxID=2028108 RepID=A0A840WLT7_9RHOB|nr:MFS transporter [Rubricella aquisinus]MBB5515511.1 putative MFS family arabinose efflux permease [Rubricella aquisinus]
MIGHHATGAKPIATPAQTVRLIPWYRFCLSLMFWQAAWFLYFQNALSAAEAILLYAVYDIATTVLEVPSGYLSDRLGRRRTLIAAATAQAIGAGLLAMGGGFAVFAAGQIMLGTGAALLSGTDSSLLYESLAEDGQADMIEAQEVRAWRFSFAGFALSAITGGAMALYSDALPFLAGAGAAVCAIWIASRFHEPAHARPSSAIPLKSLGIAFRTPVLTWLFVLSLLMYGYSHIPFVFGQPFILEALDSTGFAATAPLVSGAVTTVMMLLSVAASVIAVRLRDGWGLSMLLLIAFGMQIALAGALALSNSLIVVGLLFLRMVPDALSRPFILARIQPMLSDDSRATYLSLQSLAGRVLFAGSLILASGVASDAGQMAYADLQVVLGGYALFGLLCLIGLALAARHVPLNVKTAPSTEGRS